MRFDLSAKSFSLANAQLCAQASADAYNPLSDVARARLGALSQIKVEKPLAHVTVSTFDGFRLAACRGTKSITDIVTDIEISRENIRGTDVHRGFYNSTDTVVADVFSAVAINDGRPLVITGHSLGGAQAAVLAQRLRFLGIEIHSVYTFGKPRVGNKAWATDYNKNPFPSFRVTNATDPIPWLPWVWWAYYHEAIEVFMPDPEKWMVLKAPLDFDIAPGFGYKLIMDGAELYRLWRDIQTGNFAHMAHHPIERYQERLAS